MYFLEKLIYLTAIVIIATILSNVFGFSITKYGSSLTRSITDVLKTVLIWCVGLLVTIIEPDADWENTDWKAIILELIGFSIMLFGNLVFSHILKL